MRPSRRGRRPICHRSCSTSFGAPYADTIYLLRADLGRVRTMCLATAEHIRVAVLHEARHRFCYTEGRLRRMGLA